MGNENKKEGIPIGAKETPETVRAKKIGFFLGSISAINLAIAELTRMRKEMEAMFKTYEKTGKFGEGNDKSGGNFPTGRA